MLIDGKAPGDAGFQGHPGNHQQIRDWLLALGCEPARVEGMRVANLFKAYRYPEYLRCMTQRKDYFPNGLQDITEELGPCTTTLSAPSATIAPDAATIGLAPTTTTVARGAMLKAPSTKPSSPDASTPSPAATSPPGITSPSDTLATLLQAIQRPLTEARVIELIREYAPQIIRECLS